MHEKKITFTGISKIAKFRLNLSKWTIATLAKIHPKKEHTDDSRGYLFFPHPIPRVHDTRGRPCNHLEDVG